LHAADGALSRVAELLSTSPATVKSRLAQLSHPELTRSLRAHPLATALDEQIAAVQADGEAARLLDQIEAVILRELFVYCRGNKSRMARVLGWSRQTLLRRVG
jgi:DNA-binding protein Fis